MSSRQNGRVIYRAKPKSKQPRFNVAEPSSFYASLLGWTKSAAESAPDYLPNTMARDKWLSDVWKLEPHIAGILHSITSLDSNRGWTLEGGRNQVLRFTPILHGWIAAPGVSGWRPGCSAAAMSYYTSDLGYVSEIGRNGEQGPVQQLYHVDPTRCRLTGNMEMPLEYYPEVSSGGEGYVGSWKVEDYLHGTSMISIRESMYGAGYCFVSRALEFTQIMVAVFEHNKEQLGAKAPKGLLLLNNISQEQWEKSLEAGEANLDGNMLNYYDAVAVIASMGAPIGAELIALSQLPQNFNLQEFVNFVMFGYALCAGYDPSEFYPVQYGALGRGTEMEVQHQKATGKGGKNFIFSLQEQMQREDFLPASLKVEFDQRDEQAELEQANVAQAWINAYRAVRESGLNPVTGEGGISAAELRILLADKELIPQEWTEAEEQITTTDESPQPLGIEVGNVQPDNSSTAILAELVAATSRKRRALRDHLMTQRHILRCIERFPQDDIVRYHWPMNDTVILWRQAETLLERQTYPAAKPSNVLYQSGDVKITTEDVQTALDEIETTQPELFSLLKASAL